MWVGDTCVTQVEASDGTFRRSVFGSLYPLAEWIATNWWVLKQHIRPSAVDTRYWAWTNVRSYPWLRQHNLRAAGDGMPWPNMTLVTEGPVCRLVWRSDTRRTLGPIRFASSGTAVLRTPDMLERLAAVVYHVLERLAEHGLPKTRLAEEWLSVAALDAEELEFCAAVAQLGLDPFSVDDATAADVVRIAAALPTDLVNDFFDSAEVSALAEAAKWAQKAVGTAARAAARAKEDLSVFLAAAAEYDRDPRASIERPWAIGYTMAHAVRQQLRLAVTDQFDTSPWVGVSVVSAPSRGIRGVAAVRSAKCGLVFGGSPVSVQTSRFRQAQAIGRVVAHPDRETFLLSSAHGHAEKVARAFAAELLAPAAGIHELLLGIDDEPDSALERVARDFNVSPLVVRHQYDNQLTKAFE